MCITCVLQYLTLVIVTSVEISDRHGFMPLLCNMTKVNVIFSLE